MRARRERDRRVDRPHNAAPAFAADIGAPNERFSSLVVYGQGDAMVERSYHIIFNPNAGTALASGLTTLIGGGTGPASKLTAD